jgi:hypothetical protein
VCPAYAVRQSHRPKGRGDGGHVPRDRHRGGVQGTIFPSCGLSRTAFLGMAAGSCEIYVYSASFIGIFTTHQLSKFSCSHPNIIQIYGAASSGGINAILFHDGTIRYLVCSSIWDSFPLFRSRTVQTFLGSLSIVPLCNSVYFCLLCMCIYSLAPVISHNWPKELGL